MPFELIEGGVGTEQHTEKLRRARQRQGIYPSLRVVRLVAHPCWYSGDT